MQNLFEVQIIEFNEGTKLHAACICEKVLLRAKAQGTGHGLQIADGFQVVLFRHLACHTNGIGVVDPDFSQHTAVVLFLNRLVDKIVEGHAVGNVRGVQPQNGGEDRAIPVVHQVTAVIVTDERLEVVLRGHLVLDGHFQAIAVLHELLDHAVDELDFREFSLIEDNAVFILGNEAPGAHRDHTDGQSSGPQTFDHTEAVRGGTGGVVIHPVLYETH